MARTVPVAASETPGLFQTSALWNANVKALGDFLTSPPRFKGYATSTQSLASGTALIPITLDSELYDSDGGHSISVNTSRYVVQVAGTYDATGCVALAVSGTGNRAAGILVNGVAPNGSITQGAGIASNSWVATVTCSVQCVVNDYIEVGAWQTSGGALSTQITTAFGPSLTVKWISV